MDYFSSLLSSPSHEPRTLKSTQYCIHHVPQGSVGSDQVLICHYWTCLTRYRLLVQGTNIYNTLQPPRSLARRQASDHQLVLFRNRVKGNTRAHRQRSDFEISIATTSFLHHSAPRRKSTFSAVSAREGCCSIAAFQHVDEGLAHYSG